MFKIVKIFDSKTALFCYFWCLTLLSSGNVIHYFSFIIQLPVCKFVEVQLVSLCPLFLSLSPH